MKGRALLPLPFGLNIQRGNRDFRPPVSGGPSYLQRAAGPIRRKKIHADGVASGFQRSLRVQGSSRKIMSSKSSGKAFTNTFMPLISFLWLHYGEYITPVHIMQEKFSVFHKFLLPLSGKIRHPALRLAFIFHMRHARSFLYPIYFLCVFFPSPDKCSLCYTIKKAWNSAVSRPGGIL